MVRSYTARGQFDSFGLALDMRNRIIVERADQFSIEVHGEGAEGEGMIRADESNLVVQMCYRALRALGRLDSMPPLRFECHNTVPCQRGLGSSSSALVAGLAAGLALGGKELYTPICKKELLQMAADEEGHADNIAAAIYGGFQVSFKSNKHWITQRVRPAPCPQRRRARSALPGVCVRARACVLAECPRVAGCAATLGPQVHVPKGLHCVLYIPDEQHLVRTEASRGALPAYYRRCAGLMSAAETRVAVRRVPCAAWNMPIAPARIMPTAIVAQG